MALGATAGFGGIVGAVAGGRIGDRWASRDAAAFAFVPAIGVLLSSVAMLMAMLSQSFFVSISCIGISYACVTGGIGVQYAASLGLVPPTRSEEHTSELQSLMRISYAVFCLKKKNTNKIT